MNRALCPVTSATSNRVTGCDGNLSRTNYTWHPLLRVPWKFSKPISTQAQFTSRLYAFSGFDRKSPRRIWLGNNKRNRGIYNRVEFIENIPRETMRRRDTYSCVHCSFLFGKCLEILLSATVSRVLLLEQHFSWLGTDSATLRAWE